MASGSLKKATPFLRVMPKATESESLPYLLKIFLNSYIRGGEKIQNSKKVTAFFGKWLDERLNKKIASIRSAPAKKKWEGQKKVIMSEYTKYTTELYFVIATYITLQTAKTLIIRKLEKAESIGTFIKTSDGYRVTAPEGFVAIDHVGRALKLVDRLEFSKANFTVYKNWKG